MRRLPLLALLAAFAAAVPASHADVAIEGTVALPPADAAPVPQERYAGGSTYTAGPADPPRAVVYLEGDVGGASVPPAPKAEMAQRHYQFSPGLLAIRRGTTVAFPNLDGEYHSVFSYSKPRRFDLGRYQKGEVPAELVFDQAGVVKLFCEIHDHMRGTILVLDTPYFTTTDANGRYRLANLPAGRFTLKAWIDEGTVRSEEVTLEPGATLRVDFPAVAASPPPAGGS